MESAFFTQATIQNCMLINEICVLAFSGTRKTISQTFRFDANAIIFTKCSATLHIIAILKFVRRRFSVRFFTLNKVPHAALHAYRIHNFNSDAFAHQILPFHWISFLMKSPRHFLRFCSSQSIKWHEINSETKLLLAKINSNFKVRQTNFSFCS